MPIHGTARRLAALVSIGWTYTALGEQLGVLPSQIGRWIHISQKIQPKSAENVLVLFERLQTKIVPSDPEYRPLRQAFPPPLAWDDETIDDPSARPAEWRRRSTWRTEDMVAEVLDVMRMDQTDRAGAAVRLGLSRAQVDKAFARVAARAIPAQRISGESSPQDGEAHQ